ncbi:MAG: hypothetical protein ACOYXT_24835, partial [Bacteroidota bacterium]
IIPVRKFAFDFFKRLLRKYLNELSIVLDETYTDVCGVLVVLEGYSHEDALRDLPPAQKATATAVSFKTQLERVGYFGSDEIKDKITHIVSLLFDVEIELKRRALNHHHPKKQIQSLRSLGSRFETPPELRKLL